MKLNQRVTPKSDGGRRELLITRPTGLRSTVTDLTYLAVEGARPAGPPPLPTAAEQDGIVEIERAVSRVGTVALAGRVILATRK